MVKIAFRIFVALVTVTVKGNVFEYVSFCWRKFYSRICNYS